MKIKLMLTMIVLAVCGSLYADCPPGDLNRDCRVDTADLVLFAQQWLGEVQAAADLDATGHVDGMDLALFASRWQQTGCPIVINEILAHAHAEASDWVELYNVSNVPVEHRRLVPERQRGRSSAVRDPRGDHCRSVRIRRPL